MLRDAGRGGSGRAPWTGVGGGCSCVWGGLCGDPGAPRKRAGPHGGTPPAAQEGAGPEGPATWRAARTSCGASRAPPPPPPSLSPQTSGGAADGTQLWGQSRSGISRGKGPVDANSRQEVTTEAHAALPPARSPGQGHRPTSPHPGGPFTTPGLSFPTVARSVYFYPGGIP